MKAVVIAASCLATASAFVPQGTFTGQRLAVRAESSRAATSMSAVNDMLGADVETKGVWDPLGYAKDEGALFRNREVELKHGRVAMLAATGYLVAEVWHPLYDGKISPGLAAISQVPAAGWLQIIAAIAIIELTIGKQDYENKAPGDLGFGLAFNPFPNDPEKFAALQLKELKNGRLAMLGFAGQVVQNYLTGQTPLEQLAAGHISPFGDGQGAF